MAYITLSKLKEITFRYDILVDSFIQLYKSKISILDKVEQKRLLQIRSIIEGLDEMNVESFKKIDRTRSKMLVYDSNPCYHRDCNCKLLIADYENFYIPDEIITRGDKSIKAFKTWFKANRNLLNRDQEAFEMRWKLKWGFTLSIKALRETNSGFVSFDNLSSEQLEKKIDSLLLNAKRFSLKNSLIINKYGKYAKKSLSKKSFNPVIEGYDVFEIKEVLQTYVNEIQEPLVQLLISWYRSKKNPELKFEGKILDQLGFKPCPACSSKHRIEKDKNDSKNPNEDLFNELRQLRSEISKGRPAYLVFDDKTLREMASKEPASLVEFGRIKGVGPVKVELYGKIFVDCINSFKSKRVKNKKSLGTLGQI